MEELKFEALEFLKKLISIKSYSREEEGTARLFEALFLEKGINYSKLKNNVWVKNKYFDPKKPTILLNSHHDTVKPNAGYTKNPHEPLIEDGKLYGLGSNDAGGPLVSLLAAFLYFYERSNMKYNFIFLASAEEEISGPNGVALVKEQLGEIDFAIVGEPTLMDAAVAEKGLIVVDCEAKGQAGHAAREEGVNAISIALEDINWINNYTFPKVSDTLGAVKMSVTLINAGTQHNVVPDRCSFVIDIRVTDAYSNKEVIQILKENLKSEVTPRSLRLNSSSISIDHQFVRASKKYETNTYGSPTMSDQALMPWLSVKMGPGDSARSHSADEYIYINEISKGIEKYVSILEELV